MRKLFVFAAVLAPSLAFAGVSATLVPVLQGIGLSLAGVVAKLGGMYGAFLLLARVLKRFGLIEDGKPAKQLGDRVTKHGHTLGRERRGR